MSGSWVDSDSMVSNGKEASKALGSGLSLYTLWWSHHFCYPHCHLRVGLLAHQPVTLQLTSKSQNTLANASYFNNFPYFNTIQSINTTTILCVYHTLVYWFHFLWIYVQKWGAGPYHRPSFTFLKKLHTVLHVCMNLYSQITFKRGLKMVVPTMCYYFGFVT
jgi:hypothetical protein